MRWLACVVFLAGCLRARATAIHPTEIERSTSGSGGKTIARTTSETPESDASTSLGSVEVGGSFMFRNDRDSARVHIAPGVRIFNSEPGNLLFGVAVGADFRNDFALEGSVYVGDGHDDPAAIEQVVDVFAGYSLDARSTSLAIGPSVGMLMMPGGGSVVMLGLGLRVSGARD
jgi:hypothetical protein